VTEARYDAVLCDIDGVIRHWPRPDALELAHGLPLGTLVATAFAPARITPAITGKVTDEQWRSGIAADLAATCGWATARATVDAWFPLEPRVDSTVVAVLGRARRDAPIALVSNATTRLESDLERLGLNGVADVVANTSRIGVAKPRSAGLRDRRRARRRRDTPLPVHR
jgi:putative hydrolase of the HAD superfamily